MPRALKIPTPTLNPGLRLLVVAWLTGSFAAASTAADLETETATGLRVEIHSDLSPVPLNRIHSWHIHVFRPNGQPLGGATVEFSGGMPEHDHGLPTAPRVTREEQPGVYLLEGLRFHMPGLWQIIVSIAAEGRRHQAQFEFRL